MEEKRFILIAQARSGSTMLRQILSSHEQIRCLGEVYMKTRSRANVFVDPSLSDEEGRARTFRLRQELPVAEFLSDYIFRFPPHFYFRFKNQPAAIGFKLIDWQFGLTPEAGDLFEHLKADTSIRRLFLFRRDALASLISQQVRHRKLDYDTPRKIAPDALRKYVSSLIDARRTWWEPLMGPNKMIFCYETLLEDLEGLCAGLVSFFDLAHDEFRIPVKKTSHPDYATFVANYDELRALYDRELKPAYDEAFSFDPA